MHIIEGAISHTDYLNNNEMNWTVNSNCESITIWSTLFQTESYFDTVTINHKQYSGRQTVYDVIGTPNFTVNFVSDESVTDDGFILQWKCLEKQKHIGKTLSKHRSQMGLSDKLGQRATFG